MREELADLIERYLRGEIPVMKLTEWEWSHADAIMRSGDKELERISGTALAAPTLLEDGAMTEDELKEELREDLKILRSAA